MDGKRYLIVTADDFGIGPATSQGILDLACQGAITGTVLLVNSPYAEQAVRSWRRCDVPLELGWHPCLTLDQPILPAQQVPTLVGADGRFHRLGRLIRNLYLGRIQRAELRAELRAQLGRFHDLVGRTPVLVNSHHHVQVFRSIGPLLVDLLSGLRPLPYLRRVREPWKVLFQVPGARAKRLFLSVLGGRSSHYQAQAGLAGNDWLAGITDPRWVADPEFLTRWLARIPGRVVELTCHPGHLDQTLIGRDCTPTDGHMQRRAHEMQLLRHPGFAEACRKAGFTLISASEMLCQAHYRKLNAA